MIYNIFLLWLGCIFRKMFYYIVHHPHFQIFLINWNTCYVLSVFGLNLVWPLQDFVSVTVTDDVCLCFLSSSVLCPAACMPWWRCSTPSPGNTPSSPCCQGPCWISSAVPLPSWWGSCPARCLNSKSCLWKRWAHSLWIFSKCSFWGQFLFLTLNLISVWTNIWTL